MQQNVVWDSVLEVVVVVAVGPYFGDEMVVPYCYDLGCS